MSLGAFRVSSRFRLLLSLMAFAYVPAISMIDAAAQTGVEYFVAPDGKPTNAGTAASPLDLATALSRQSPARPGDTIWLRGGTYVGTFISYVTGTAAAPITVRQYPGERATLDGHGSMNDVLMINGGHTIFWGFELTNSDPHRLSNQTGSWPDDVPRGNGVFTRAPNVKLINLVVHDLRTGVAVWSESVGSEVYGTLSYHNGWQAPDRAHGHGIYTQNQTGTRLIRENITFNQFSHGIHAYGSDAAWLDNITYEGNIAFNNGILARDGLERDLLLGGGRTAQNPVWRENYTYGGANSNLGYSAGCANGLVTGNYLAGGTPIILANCVPTMVGNDLYGTYAAQYGFGGLDTRFPDNRWYRTRPTTNFVRVRPNAYERGRAHVVIYNWERRNSVAVDLAPAGLTTGDSFEVRDAQNFYGPPVVSGVYAPGMPVNVPMAGLTLARPIGNVPVQPVHTAPEFGVFVVLKSASSPLPPAPDPPPSVVAAPVISPAGEAFISSVTVSITSPTAGASIRYTSNGSPVTTTSPIYTKPIVLTATTTINARAFAAGMVDSPTTSETFTNIQVAAPIIRPNGGNFNSPVTVTLASPTAGATIRYTTDSSIPSSTSPNYAGPFTLSTSRTLNVRAFKAGMLDSAVSSGSFVIQQGTTTPPPSGGATATFLRYDDATRGTWRGVYGREGHVVVGSPAAPPSFAEVTPHGHLSHVYRPYTTDVRALQRGDDSTKRTPAVWYAPTWTLELNLTDGQAHQVTMYAVDWNSSSRTQRIEVLDAATGAVLDSRQISDFNRGRYLIWQLSGHVRFRLTGWQGWVNAIVSGLFFD